MSFNQHNLAWSLVGLGVGTAASVLFTPAAGEDLRKHLASSAREGAEYVTKGSRHAVDAVSDLADRGREQTDEAVDKAKEVAGRGSAQWEKSVDSGREALFEQAE